MGYRIGLRVDSKGPHGVPTRAQAVHPPPRRVPSEAHHAPHAPPTNPPPPRNPLELVEAARSELMVSQRKLGLICETDRRVVAKWQQGRQRPYPWHWERMARAVHPKNVALAGRLAAAGGHTLVSLGLQAPAGAVQAQQVASPPLLAAAHLVDSIVCAAAVRRQVSPHSIRPAL